jgi:hypothetical protein
MNERTLGHRGQTTYWITTVVAAVAFAIPGVANLAHANHIARDMAHLGYPQYFMTILGVWKLLATFAILAPRLPRLKEWAYAGILFDLTGAAASRAAMQDGVAMTAIPLMIGLVVIASWALRPEGRTLKPLSWRSKVPKPLWDKP